MGELMNIPYLYLAYYFLMVSYNLSLLVTICFIYFLTLVESLLCHNLLVP